VTGPRLALGTVCVPNVEAALQLYAGLLEQDIIADSKVSVDEASAWQALRLVDARSVVLQPPSKAPVYLRLIRPITNPARISAGLHWSYQ
jgi:hypothetical protein